MGRSDLHVRRLEIGVDDALLVRVLHTIADLAEQLDAFAQRELVLVAILDQRWRGVRACSIGRENRSHAQLDRLVAV